jgi:hypothetical protein
MFLACSGKTVEVPASSSSSGSSSGGSSSGGGRDGGAAGDASIADQERVLCDAYASTVNCPNRPAPLSCDDSDKCYFVTNMTPEGTSAYAACRAAPSCKGEDLCIREAGLAVGGDAAKRWETACTDRRATCGRDAFDDDFCTAGLFAYRGNTAGIVKCLEESCDGIEKCFVQSDLLQALQRCK